MAACGGRVVHDPLVDEEAAPQLEQLSAGGADVAVVAVRRRKVRIVLVQGAARGELQGWMDAWLSRPLALTFQAEVRRRETQISRPFSNMRTISNNCTVAQVKAK